MGTDLRFGLFLMGRKGAAVLRRLVREAGPDAIAFVVTSPDPGMEEDGEHEIREIAGQAGVPVFERVGAPDASTASHLLAVAWRWMIEPPSERPLVVIHDSLLPRYRGFAPLVSALVNGDTTLGATALVASTEYDRGPVLAQSAIKVRYPLRIAEAIEAILPCYEELAERFVHLARSSDLKGEPQDESEATYSLWRDESDYEIDWTSDAARIRRFVDAVGHPYRGAATTAHGRRLRVRDCLERPDVAIENRSPGKVIFVEEEHPVVVCGSGLLKILALEDEITGRSALPLSRFRTRFGSSVRLLNG